MLKAIFGEVKLNNLINYCETLFGMNESVSAFIKNGGTYMFFSIVNRAIPFLLLPVLTSYIAPEGYGVISVFMIIMSISMPLTGLCSNSVLVQKYFKIDDEQRVYLVNDSYKIMAVMYLIFAVAVFLLQGVLSSWLKISAFWIQIALLSGMLGMIVTLTNAIMQLKKQAFRFGMFQAVNMLLNVCLTVLFVVYLKYSWQGRLSAIFISYVIVAVIAIAYNFKAEIISFAKMKHSPQLKNIIFLGGALIPGTIAGWAISMSDRLFLTRMTTLEIVGIYSVGVMIAQITDVVLNSISLSYMPFFYERVYKNEEKTRIRLVQATYLLALFALLTALSVYGFASIVINYIVNERFVKAINVVGFISLSYALWSIGSLFYNYILAAEKNKIISYVSYATLAANVFANYFLVQRYGMIGAAISNTLSSGLFMTLLLLAALKYHPMPWLDKRVLKWKF